MKIDISQLEYIDKRLRKILVWLEKETGLELTITSQYRIGDRGVHGTLPLRGTDLRVRSKTVGKELELLVNDVWEYNSKKPGRFCAMMHGKGANLHLHIQTHPNTKKRPISIIV